MSLTVFCDSSRHARGKIAKLVEYQLLSDGELFAWTGRQRRREERTLVAAKDGIFRDSLDPEPVCKLCASRVPRSPLLDNAIRQLLGAGESSISLSDLRSRLRDLERQ
jgi:hypothetical protein